MICALLKRLKVSRKLRYWVSVGILVGYALLVGGSLSVIRAMTMHIMLLTAAVTKHRGDMLTALAAAFLVSALINPASVYALGFQLSYGCVFVILCLADSFGKRKILSAVGVSFCGLLATSVILWNINYTISPLTLLMNLIAVPIAGVTVPVLFLTTIVYCIFGGATVYLGFFGKALLFVLNFITSWSRVLCWEISVKGISEIGILLIFAGVFLTSKYFIAKKRIKLCCVITLVVAFFMIAVNAEATELPQITFLASEYGESAVLTDGNQSVILDAGTSSGLDYVRAYGMNVDAVYLSGENARQIGNLKDYLELEIYAPRELQDGKTYALTNSVSLVPIISEEDAQADYVIYFQGKAVLLYMGGPPQAREYPQVPVVKLSSDSNKNIDFAGRIGAEYVILREHTEKFAAISMQDAGAVSVCYDGEVTVESIYDCGTVYTTTDS